MRYAYPAFKGTGPNPSFNEGKSKFPMEDVPYAHKILDETEEILKAIGMSLRGQHIERCVASWYNYRKGVFSGMDLGEILFAVSKKKKAMKAGHTNISDFDSFFDKVYTYINTLEFEEKYSKSKKYKKVA